MAMQVNPAKPAPGPGNDGQLTLLPEGQFHAAITFVNDDSTNRWTGQPEWAVSFKDVQGAGTRKAWLDYAGVQNLIAATFGRADRHFEGRELVGKEVGISVTPFTRKDGTSGLKVAPDGFYSVQEFQKAPGQPQSQPSTHTASQAAPVPF